MDIEYVKIKEILSNNEELNEIMPKSNLIYTQDIIRNIALSINDFMDASSKKDLNSSINALTKVLYCVLETFVKEGIYPSSIFEIVVLSKLDRIWIDGKIHYNEFNEIVPPRNWCVPYNDFRIELNKMFDNKYKINEDDISNDYEKVKKLYQQSGFQYRKELGLMSSKDSNHLSYRLYYMLEAYLNCDDKLDVAHRLGEILYYVMCAFVEMGCNPKEYLDNYIDTQKKRHK